MPFAIRRALFSCNVGEREGAPVGDAADDAASREDHVASRAGDAGREGLDA